MDPSKQIFLEKYIKWLKEKNQYIPNFYRQKTTCECMTKFLEPLGVLGGERVMLVGSTTSNIRLKMDNDEGDYDYLIISETKVPESALVYDLDHPCFVKIDGSKLTSYFPCSLINDKYVPTDLLKYVKSPAFYQARGIYEFVTHSDIYKKKVQIATNTKVGISLDVYHGFQCSQLIYPAVKDSDADKHYAERMHQKISEDDILKTNMDILSSVFSLGTLVESLINKIDAKEKKRGNSFTTPHFSYMINALSRLFSARDDDSPVLTHVTSNAETEKGKCMTQNQEVKAAELAFGDEFSAVYAHKASKDIVACFSIEGKLPCWESFTKRHRKWPSCEVVNKLASCEIFVVCKPSILNPRPETDFCLAFNLAEEMLAECLNTGQKNCILMIKSLCHGPLMKYKDQLTTFMWKTALYWISEQKGSDFFDESKPLESFNAVLNFMEASLKAGTLQHYFIESNLFSPVYIDGIKIELITLLQSIQKDAVCYFKTIQDSQHNCQQVKFSRRTLQELQEIITNPCSDKVIDRHVRAFKYLITDERPDCPLKENVKFSDKLIRACEMLAEVALPMWANEEMYRDCIQPENQQPSTQFSNTLIQAGVQLISQHLHSESREQAETDKTAQLLGIIFNELKKKKK